MLGRPRSDHWVWIFFACEGSEATCKVETDAGPCNHAMARHVGNCQLHLQRKHNIGEREGRARQAEISAQRKLPTAVAFSQAEMEVLACAEGLRPFSLAEGRWFRAAFAPTIRKGETMKAQTLLLEEKLREQAVSRMAGRGAALCFDSGTVFNRYLCLVVCCSGVAPFCLGFVRDEEFAVLNGEPRLTSQNVQWLLERTVGDLKKRGVVVTGIVADNAAAFQSDACHVEGVLHQRCAAHSVQLVAKEIMAQHPSLSDDVRYFCELKGFATPCETRWNSTYDVCVRIAAEQYEDQGDAQHVRSIRAVLPKLKPFAVATDFLQRDDATIFNQLQVIEFFLKTGAVVLRAEFHWVFLSCFELPTTHVQ